jgi:hypothetical protein
VVSSNPNGGAYSTQALLVGANPTSLTGFDILSGPDGSNVAYGAFKPAPGFPVSSLYEINLTTGVLTIKGPISREEDDFEIRGIAVAPIPEPASFALVWAGAAALLARRPRR